MRRAWIRTAVCLGILVSVMAAWSVAASRGQRGSETIVVDGQTRSFELFVPPTLDRDRPAPLVLVFHGGRGDGPTTARLTRFRRIAMKERFLVVFPDGVDRHWNDGRKQFSRARQVDDIAFVHSLIDEIDRRHPVDPRRIYATGISNGGIFSHTLGLKSDRFAAIAPVVGGLAEPVAKEHSQEQIDSPPPVSVMIVQGTDDPLVPYEGGAVARRRGRIVSTDEALRFWRERNGIADSPTTGSLPDTNATDGCVVETVRWRGRDGVAVVLYRIEGGGHTWPGGPQYMPKAIIGGTCLDFDASEAIWEFFRAHPKPIVATGT